MNRNSTSQSPFGSSHDLDPRACTRGIAGTASAVTIAFRLESRFGPSCRRTPYSGSTKCHNRLSARVTIWTGRQRVIAPSTTVTIAFRLESRFGQFGREAVARAIRYKSQSPFGSSHDLDSLSRVWVVPARIGVTIAFRLESRFGLSCGRVLLTSLLPTKRFNLEIFYFLYVFHNSSTPSKKCCNRHDYESPDKQVCNHLGHLFSPSSLYVLITGLDLSFSQPFHSSRLFLSNEIITSINLLSQSPFGSSHDLDTPCWQQ